MKTSYKSLRIIILLLIIIAVIYGSKIFNKKNQNDTMVESDNTMSFFVTSTNPGNGANFGGFDGADQHCQTLAETTAVNSKNWSAYLSGIDFDNKIINARDRIGTGPWYNFNGDLIASSVNDLHENPNITKETALTETGQVVNGRGDSPNQHDILTGSDTQGMAIISEEDTTCNNWTSGTTGSAMVGHSDRIGLDESDASKSWNSSHQTRGCSLDSLRSTGGEGLIYCFAK